MWHKVQNGIFAERGEPGPGQRRALPRLALARPLGPAFVRFALVVVDASVGRRRAGLRFFGVCFFFVVSFVFFTQNANFFFYGFRGGDKRKRKRSCRSYYCYCYCYCCC